MALRVCSESGCPELVDKGKCPEHRATHERRRGTPQQRGYGAAHQQLRRSWAPKVALGIVDCWRCGERITALEPWHLGHDDHDRSKYRGPEHVACNTATAGR